MKERRLTAFISSKMKELATERQVAKKALAQLQIDAWVFEDDAGARSETIQQAYLSELANCDLYIGVFWKGYGEYTIEEFNFARELGIPTLIYEKRADLDDPVLRDERLQAFLDRISEVESGLTIKWFKTHEEFGKYLREDIPGWVADVVREKQKVHAPEVELHSTPLPTDFIGREKELDFYQEKLEKKHFIIIKGGPGIGKTYLGATLAWLVGKCKENIFWFNFDPIHKTEADMLFWHLAEFFKEQGDDRLRSYLLGELRARKPLPKSEKLSIFLRSLEAGKYVICLDDFHHVENVADITDLFTLLDSTYRGHEEDIPARFIIMGRSVPAVMQHTLYAPLDKFSEKETEEFIHKRGLDLSPEFSKHLYQSTQGHPKILDLSFSVIAEKGDDSQAVEKFIENMASQRDIREHILEEIDKQLPSHDEKLVLAALTIFLSDVDIPTLEEILADQEIENVTRCVDTLLDRHIISQTEDGLLEIHSIVSEYFYQRELNPKSRDHLHNRAANYFLDKKDYLGAAHHFDKCRNTAHSIEILTEHVEEIINTGWGGALLERLSSFRRPNVNSQQWVAVKQASGRAHERRGNYEIALQDYGTALDEATTNEVSAEILLSIGKTYTFGLGKHTEARENLAKSLALGEIIKDQALIAEIHTSLGWICYRLHDFEQAINHFTKGQDLAQLLRNRPLFASANLGLGGIDHAEKRYDQARERFEKSQIVFHEYEMPVEEAQAIANLGIIADERGDFEKGFEYFKQAMKIFKNISAIVNLQIAYLNLGFNRCYVKEYQQAAVFFEKAAELSRDTGHLERLCQANSGLATAYTQLKKLDLALEHAEQAYQLAKEIGNQSELGISALALGDVWLAKEEPIQARQYYEESIPLLEAAKYYDEELDMAQKCLEQALSQIGAENTLGKEESDS